MRRGTFIPLEGRLRTPEAVDWTPQTPVVPSRGADRPLRTIHGPPPQMARKEDSVSPTSDSTPLIDGLLTKVADNDPEETGEWRES